MMLDANTMAEERSGSGRDGEAAGMTLEFTLEQDRGLGPRGRCRQTAAAMG